MEGLKNMGPPSYTQLMTETLSTPPTIPLEIPFTPSRPLEIPLIRFGNTLDTH